VLVRDGDVVARVANPVPDRPAPVPSASGGYGLPGLREQVVARGGALTSGREGDDWVVTCVLPQAPALVPEGER
jgi:glucose-6-phosphate-specific signal transduction histidine kinase